MTEEVGPDDPVQSQLRGTDRIKALSDGVFAIVLPSSSSN
jgi:hypothetical protein